MTSTRGRIPRLRNFFAACILVVLSVFAPRITAAQYAPTLSDSSAISVITILPGDPLYSAFGHTAIRVRDDSAGFDVGYNYGTFDFEEEGFYIKFLRGKLDYRLARDRFDDMEWAYRSERRPIIEQRLDLSRAERQELFELLEINYLPENRAYRYEFLYDNCSTRPRDVIEAAWGDRMEGVAFSTEETFRDLIDRYLEGMTWTRFGIDLLLGSTTDVVASPRERMFMPDEFLSALDAARSDHGARLAHPPDTLFWAPGYVRWPGGPAWPAIVGWILLFGIAALSMRPSDTNRSQAILRRFDGLYFGVIGILGILIMVLWFATEHAVTKSNWNLAWALPTHVFLAVALWRESNARWLVPYLWLTLSLVAITVVGWTWIPQELTPWAAPYLGIIVIRSAMGIREEGRMKNEE